MTPKVRSPEGSQLSGISGHNLVGEVILGGHHSKYNAPCPPHIRQNELSDCFRVFIGLYFVAGLEQTRQIDQHQLRLSRACDFETQDIVAEVL